MIPAVAVVDVMNVYGLSGHVVGTRRKPTPDGVASALAPYGFDVQQVDFPIGKPDSDDVPHVLKAVEKAVSDLKRMQQELCNHPSIWGGYGPTRMAQAIESLASPMEGSDLGSHMLAINLAVKLALGHARKVVTTLKSTRETLVRQARERPNRAVGPQDLEALDACWQAMRAFERVQQEIQSISSYAYAGERNLAHLADLTQWSGPPVVTPHEGRFRPGFDGGSPDEKQVDTICAVACIERTQQALSAGGPRAVIVLSDDDDLTPALRSAAALASGTDVRVVVAGSGKVRNRFESEATGPSRPRWLVFDQDSRHLVVGCDPVAALVERHITGQLAVGRNFPFLPDNDSRFATSGTLRARMAPGCTSPPATYALLRLEWGRGSDASHVPRPIVHDAAAAKPGTPGVCLPAAGTRLSSERIPVDLGQGSVVMVNLPAPGWWRAGDHVILARAEINGAPWRIVGPENSPGIPPATAHRGKVTRLKTERGTWATVAAPQGHFSVLADSALGLQEGDEVAVVPYEITAPKGRRPRALLLSSQL